MAIKDYLGTKLVREIKAMGIKGFVIVYCRGRYIMYEINKAKRLKTNQKFKGLFYIKYKPKGITRDPELGIFITESGDRFLVYKDLSAIKIW